MKFKFFYLYLILLSLFIGYQYYLRFQQRYEVGACLVDIQTNEIYKISNEAKRRLSFKDNWFFAPMTIQIETLKVNPNTLHKIGEVHSIEQDDKSYKISQCS